MTIEERVVDIIADVMGVESSEIKGDDSITGVIGADSLDTVEIVMEIEEDFGVEISDEDAENLSTPNQIATYLRGKGIE